MPNLEKFHSALVSLYIANPRSASRMIKEANDKTLYKKSNKTRLKAAWPSSKSKRAQQPALEKSKSSLDAYAQELPFLTEGEPRLSPEALAAT